MGAEEAISEALRPAVQAAGLEIWDVERSGASVRVLVERDGGVDLDSISDVSRSISAVLDERDDLVPAGRYTLEVSSPGLERRLRYPRHFARYIGQEVAVKTAAGHDGPRRLRGTLVGATDLDITLRAAPPSDLGEEEVCLPLSSVERANAVFSWGAPAKAPRAARPAKRGSVNPRTSPTDRGRDDRRPAVAAQEA
jgi:ribosome maturation factor RimP